MTGKNATPLIGWHSADPTLKPRIQAEAERRGITVREVLDEMAAEYFEKVDFALAHTANRAIRDRLNQTGDPS